jgi:hypothetical protein
MSAAAQRGECRESHEASRLEGPPRVDGAHGRADEMRDEIGRGVERGGPP